MPSHAFLPPALHQAFPPSLLSQEIALVGQVPNLFSGSIAYNIAYGQSARRTEEEIAGDPTLMVGIHCLAIFS
ncbi:hypothetical protein Naga_102698g1 [Nannochloropsis gaditana]|uniref:Uncharacterized protein n=1 Tax=Nannochloropsis gaditana TaxID=72520 RepID=W7SZS2_9STRA|nr:hypothetical protein Naga_102698g1 [Nannochloropsis gaditana]